LSFACSDADNPVATPDGNGTGDSNGSSSLPLRGDDTYGADTNPTGNPVGGGQGYTAVISRYTYLVTNKEELLATLQKALRGDIVYLADTARVDLTGMREIEIAGGVTLASGRGRDGSEGGLIYSLHLDTWPLFRATGPDIRFTGVRLQGPDPERRTEQMQALLAEDRYYSLPNSNALQSAQPRLEVDNCEFWGWSHGAVYLRKDALKASIHHNYFHHNQRHGLGYGVVLDQANALIEANLFDYCRHHIAGTGRPGTSYEARYNLVLENANSHSFDMHGGRDRGDGTGIAGGIILIHHNTFRAIDVAAVVIRGVPTEICDVYNNWFYREQVNAAAKQIYDTGNFRHYKNQYGPGRTVKD
jgi:hypothetical protein